MKKKKKEALILKILMIIILIFIVFVSINIVKTNYSIVLYGDSTIEILEKKEYIEPGYIVYKRNGDPYEGEITIENNVNTNIVGEYVITYKKGLTKVTRIVKVIEDTSDEIKYNYDDNYEYKLWTGSTFVLPTIKANDPVDGDISSKIKIINNDVDINFPGDYSVKYTVTNSRKGIKEFNLKVKVYDLNYTYKEEYIDKKLNGIFEINDDIYSKIVDPTNKESTINKYNFIYEKNDYYEYKIYDKNNNYLLVTKNVGKVDISAPVLKCTLKLYDSNSTIEADATDDIGILDYTYIYGKNTKKITDNKYTYTDSINTASVEVSDLAGNVTRKDCTVEDKSSKYTRSYELKNGHGYSYYLYIPPTLTKRNDLPLVIWFPGSGERGGSVDKVNVWGFPKYVKAGQDYDFILVAPHTTSSSYRYANMIELLDEIANTYHVNKNRIFVSGFSLGAGDTYDILKAYPNYFAGAIPIALYHAISTTTLDKYKHVPVMAFHSQNDSHYNEHRTVANYLISKNSKSSFTNTGKLGHAGTCEAVCKDNKNVFNFIKNTVKTY